MQGSGPEGNFARCVCWAGIVYDFSIFRRASSCFRPVKNNLYELSLLFVFETFAFFVIAYLLGSLVVNRGLSVNYSRKILQIFIYLAPVLASVFSPKNFNFMPHGLDLYPYDEFGKYFSVLDISIILAFAFSGFCSLLWTYAFSQKFLRKFKLLQITYAAIDRHEDRPNVLVWLRREIIATYIIIILYLMFFYPDPASIREALKILLVPIFVSSIGDGLSGIIGYRYGKHPYKVRALFTKQEYARTLEGSFCLFLSAAAAIAFIYFPANAAEWPRFLTLLAVVPAVMTLAEAKSPHSWDNPLIVLAGLLSISLVLFLFP